MPRQPSKNRAEFERMKAEINRRMLRLYKALTLEAHKRIVMRTPVDTGRARGNWFIDKIPSSDVTDQTDRSGNRSLARSRKHIASLTMEDKTWIVNNLEYIGVLENGGYPNPPKRGSWVKGTGWVIKSSGGFSKQAPQGMVRVTVEEIKAMLPILVEQVRNNVK